MSTTTKICTSLLVLLPVATLWTTACTRDDSADDSSVQESSGEPETTGEGPIPTTTEGATDSTGNAVPDSTSAVEMGTSETGDESTSESGEEPSTTSPAEPVCGDGMIGGAEECDDGFTNNKLTNSCLPNCIYSRCGDGFIETGVEECDFGDALNSYEYGGCLPATCKWGPQCGDGDLDVPEEVCDPGDPSGQGEGVVECDADCRCVGRMVFISSQKYNGDMGGLSGADDLCREMAATFDKKHAANYVAWLSDEHDSMLDRIEHSEIFANTPYVLRSGVAVAASFEALLANGPWPGIDITETYESVSNVTVWTGTGKDGDHVSESDYCGNWNSKSDGIKAWVGRNRLVADALDYDEWKEQRNWTSWLSKYCDSKYRIYCFEN